MSGHTVLIVDDSPTSRDVLTAIFSQHPELKVIGTAQNGREAIEKTKSLKPDVITMDIHMPVMDGLAATKEIMIEAPTPIVIVSANNQANEVETTMLALKAGALTVMMKPTGPHAPDFAQRSKELVRTVLAMADVLVIRHRRSRDASSAPESIATVPFSKVNRLEVIAIVASPGGPPALAKLLKGLPANFPVPILLVQHIIADFLPGFAAWLGSVVPMRVTVAVGNQALQPGTVYVGPHGFHLGVSRGRRIQLSDSEAIHGFRPAGTHLFASVGRAFGKAAAGVILTGMGRDGVDGLAEIKAAGGPTIAQDEATSVVFGMPQAAIGRQLIDTVLPIDEIAQHLIKIA